MASGLGEAKLFVLLFEPLDQIRSRYLDGFSRAAKLRRLLPTSRRVLTFAHAHVFFVWSEFFSFLL